MCHLRDFLNSYTHLLPTPNTSGGGTGNLSLQGFVPPTPSLKEEWKPAHGTEGTAVHRGWHLTETLGAKPGSESLKLRKFEVKKVLRESSSA